MKNEKCFDIGTIQAFTDGELSSGLSEKVIKHIALCDNCALMLAETEEENAFAFSAFDDELNVLVPTERLRTKVFDTIREIESEEKSAWWKNFIGNFGFLKAFNFNSPSFAVFASVVLFVSVFAVGVNYYLPKVDINAVGDQIASNENGVNDGITIVDSPNKIADDDSDSFDVDLPNVDNDVYVVRNVNNDRTNAPRIIKTGGIKNDRETSGYKVQKANYVPKIETPVAKIKPVESANLAGEDNYLQTIATLNRTVDVNKDIILRPAERVAFETDLAVVDDAIKKMKNEVRKNPNNQAAREVLRSSYKNKIDLLNSVAEKTELMASIQ